MASAEPSVDWQSTTDTILERNRHMFNNSDMSDVTLKCEGSAKIFYAHKYVLGTSSAVFQAMFYGGLAEKNLIILTDTDNESLEEFLRYLYAEECTVTADNVFKILYLAKKYLLSSLHVKCVSFLVINLSAENVLNILEQATHFEEKYLKKRCWMHIISNTKNVVSSDDFNNISQKTLIKLLMQDTLDISELELFQVVLKWIKFQCSRKELEPTAANQRSVIGRAIYKFRFFAMSHAEFIQHVSKSGLLTTEELILIYEKFLGTDSPSLKWRLPNRKRREIVRFSRKIRRIWYESLSYHSGQFRISVSKDVLLLGVRFVAHIAGIEHQVTVKVKEAKVNRTYVSERTFDDNSGFDVMLKEPVMIMKDEDVTISGTIKGARYFLAEDENSFAVSRKEVTVTFSDVSDKFGGHFHRILLSILY